MYSDFEEFCRELKYVLLSAYRGHKKTVNFSVTLANAIMILSKIRCCPSITTVRLFEELEMSRRSVQRYIATLKAAGEWIEYNRNLKEWKLTDRKSVLWGDWLIRKLAGFLWVIMKILPFAEQKKKLLCAVFWQIYSGIKLHRENGYHDLRYHITSGDTEQVTEKPDKGVINFAVLAEETGTDKYHYLTFPSADLWGVVMPGDCPLAKKQSVSVDDLTGFLYSARSSAGPRTYPDGAEKRSNPFQAVVWNTPLLFSQSNNDILANYITNSLT